MISSTGVGLLLVLSTLASVAYGGWFTFRPESWLRSLVKTVPVACLALIVWASSEPLALTAALALGALGDFWLSRPGERAFLLGLASFALAHVALVVLLWPVAGIVLNGWTLLPVVLAVALAAVVVPRAGALKGPVAIYAAIIAAMGVVAFQPEHSYLVALAATLFLGSDSCLGVSLFVLGKDRPAQTWLQPVIWFTYWAAQLLFTFAFVLLWIT